MPSPLAAARRSLRRPVVLPTLAAGVAAATAIGLGAARRRRTATPGARPQGIGVPTGDGVVLRASVVRPEGPPRGAVVLAHGWMMGRGFWTAHARLLADAGWLAVTYDQRGHGGSTRPGPGGYELRRLGHDLDAVLAHVVPDDLDVALVGHSMGAMSILAWAARDAEPSDRIVATVLANTAAERVISDTLAGLTGTTSRAVHDFLRRVVTLPLPIPPGPMTARAVGLVAHAEGVDGDVIAQTTSLLRACHPTVRVGFARELDRLDLSDGVARLTVPTLVVTGTRDLLTPPAHAERLAADLPDGRLHVVPGGGHQLPLEDPAAFTDLLLSHVSRGRRDDAPVAPELSVQ